MSFKSSGMSMTTRRKAIAGLAAAHATASKTPSQILPRLYLSSYNVATDEAQLLALGVTHVISVMEWPPQYDSDAIKTLHINVEDTFRTDILKHLDVTTAYIKEALEENETNKVLVHCLMGISRSATVVCAYLIATMSLDPTAAVEFVTKRRSIVSPNVGFQAQLQTYALRFCAEGDTNKRVTRSYWRSIGRGAKEAKQSEQQA